VRLLAEDRHFGFVEDQAYRHWQTLDRQGVLDLVASRSNIAGLPEDERAHRLQQVGELYDGYGRGHDGMQLPYITRCYRTVVQQQDPEDEPGTDEPATGEAGGTAEPPRPEQEDPGTLLIDFR
jgi:hypothetical protein